MSPQLMSSLWRLIEQLWDLDSELRGLPPGDITDDDEYEVIDHLAVVCSAVSEAARVRRDGEPRAE